MISFGGLVAAALLVRALGSTSAPGNTPHGNELIFIFLAFTHFLYGLLLLRYVKNRLTTVGTVVAGVVLLSSAAGALLRSLVTEVPGARAPVVFHFQRPVTITAAADCPARRIPSEITFGGAAGTSLEKRFEAVSSRDLELYLRIPVVCGAGPCEMWAVHPKTGALVSATRRPYDFEIRFRDDHPFALDVSAPLTLVFKFSDHITLYARDIGAPSSTRSDRFVHGGKELTLPYDHLLFARFMFVDADGNPHSAIY